jgi:flagellar motor switch protein FliN/FliY
MAEDSIPEENLPKESMENKQAKEFKESKDSKETVATDGGLGLLCDVELDATLQFGSREMSLRDVLELGPGDVIELDRHVADPVDLVVGDRIVARGEVVVASGNFALRITEVATPQLRLESIRCLF